MVPKSNHFMGWCRLSSSIILSLICGCSLILFWAIVLLIISSPVLLKYTNTLLTFGGSLISVHQHSSLSSLRFITNYLFLYTPNDSLLLYHLHVCILNVTGSTILISTAIMVEIIIFTMMIWSVWCWMHTCESRFVIRDWVLKLHSFQNSALFSSLYDLGWFPL